MEIPVGNRNVTAYGLSKKSYARRVTSVRRSIGQAGPP
jgi:hypothetical protein